jgi:hypothetical protein
VYGLKPWSLTLRVSENRVLTRIYEPKGEKVTAGLRKLDNKQLHNFYFSTNMIQIIKLRG